MSYKKHRLTHQRETHQPACPYLTSVRVHEETAVRILLHGHTEAIVVHHTHQTEV